MENIDLL